ncbi:MAG: hypothetical protein ACRDHP_16200, partial [Ktedonobacterales bacterium]
MSKHDSIAGAARSAATGESAERTTRPRAAWRSRYEQGVIAMPLALAPAFAVAALFGVPTPLEPLAEAVMQLTPVSAANVLLGLLGP